MAKAKKMTKREKDLTRRYLVWCYKTTKEELDKIDRYFTQLEVDKFVLGQLRASKAYRAVSDAAFNRLVNAFEEYMAEKKSNVVKKKFKDIGQMTMNPDYQYLNLRLAAIEKAITRFLGANELGKINRMYEEEMTGRIISAREHT